MKDMGVTTIREPFILDGNSASTAMRLLQKFDVVKNEITEGNITKFKIIMDDHL